MTRGELAAQLRRIELPTPPGAAARKSWVACRARGARLSGKFRVTPHRAVGLLLFGVSDAAVGCSIRAFRRHRQNPRFARIGRAV
jgi:hypothetical protein